MPAPATTHAVSIGATTVHKRYRSWQRGEPGREWAALQVLDQHCHGLAPTPLRSWLDRQPPCIQISRLPGEPLTSLRPPVVAAIVDSLGRLHSEPPADAVDRLPTRLADPAAAVATLREQARPMPDARAGSVAAAAAAGAGWLASEEASRLAHAAVPPVLGHGDGNLANLLWDGQACRLVDFEDAGRSDRAYEVADLCEHISVWGRDAAASDLLADAFDWTSGERARLVSARRLFRLFWLYLLMPGGPAGPRNPPGTLERQAARVLDALG